MGTRNVEEKKTGEAVIRIAERGDDRVWGKVVVFSRVENMEMNFWP